jgi:N-acetylglucosamine repressor
VRKIDPYDLLAPIYKLGAVSRVDLAHMARVAPSHVGGLIREAIKEGLLIESGFVPSTGGRRKVLLHVNRGAAQLMGIDIGRTNMAIVITDFAGNVVSQEWFPTVPSRGKEGLLEGLHEQVRSRLKRFPKVAAIGIAHSGVVDSRAGKVLIWPMVDGWRDIPLRQIFEDEYGLSVSVEDRVRAMAMAEQRSGHLTELRNFVLVYVGTGIMSAIFFDGRLYGGRDGLAGELGHTTVADNGETCSCGNRGCLERYSSAAGILERVRAELERGVSSVLTEDTGADLSRLSIEGIVAAAQAHDRLAERFLSEAGMYLGTALASVVNLLNPEKVILTGRVPQTSGELLLRPLLYNLRQRALPRAVENLQVVVSQLGQEAAAVGISHVAGEQVFKARCRTLVGSPKPSTLPFIRPAAG